MILLRALVALVVLGSLTFAQTQPRSTIKATTKDGERVLLDSDGTWKRVVDTPAAPRWRNFGELRKVTLYSRIKYPEAELAWFNFVHGVTKETDQNLRLSHNLWELGYETAGRDQLAVPFQRGGRSRIQDLGRLVWDDLKAVPLLPPYPESTRAPSVEAFDGHIYLVRVKDPDADLYALFRVDDLKSTDSCTISWIVVPSPEPPLIPSSTGARTYSGQPVVIEPNGTWRPDMQPIEGRNWSGVVELRTARLLSRRRHASGSTHLFSFIHGVRGGDPNSQKARVWDITYGEDDDENFDVTVGGNKSRLADLGALTWDQIRFARPPTGPRHPVERETAACQAWAYL